MIGVIRYISPPRFFVINGNRPKKGYVDNSSCHLQIARAQDESAMYVMPDRLMLRIAQNLPSTFEALQVSCRHLMHWI